MLEWKIFAAGCVGAIAPEIVRLYRLRHRVHTAEISRLSVRRYLIISCLFVALGGLVAVFLEANSLHAAFYMGVSLPALISAIGGQNGTKNISKEILTDHNDSHQEKAVVGPEDVERATRRPPFRWRQYLGALFP